MDKQEWVELSLEERLHWYNNELDSLFQYLVDKEPFEDKTLLEESSQLLSNIKEVMEFELSSEDQFQDEVEKRYLKSLKEAYRDLPNRFSDREKWFDNLGRANEVLLGFKMHNS